MAVVAPPALRQSAVLQELAALGIPVTNIASASGGSIIGVFVAHDGDPADFVEAVKNGRFRFKRELLSAFTLGGTRTSCRAS